MNIIRFAFVFALLAQLLMNAEEPPRLAPLTRQEVWQAISGELEQRGLELQRVPQAEEMQLPVAVPAAEGRILKVAEICQDRRRTQVRLECSGAGQCLPFLAYLPRIESKAIAACRAENRTRRVQPQTPAVRAGERALLIYAANRLRLTATVTCLERGGEGEIIRVRNQDGRIVRARVSAPGRLEVWPQ